MMLPAQAFPDSGQCGFVQQRLSWFLDPVDDRTNGLELSLKLYHKHKLRRGCQHLMAAAPSFVLTIASMSSLEGLFGPGLPLRLDENSRWYFRFLRARWRFSKVDGFSAIAGRIRRAGYMNRAHYPATRRSDALRLGARWCDRFKISS